MRKLTIPFLILCLVYLTSCTKEGPVGPAGPQGPAGATGATGPAGPGGRLAQLFTPVLLQLLQANGNLILLIKFTLLICHFLR